MHDNWTYGVPDRIASVSQPVIRLIAREKVGKPVEFGAELDIGVADGWTRLEYYSLGAHNETENLKAMTERSRKREGHCPARILVGKIFLKRNNLSYYKEHSIRFFGSALGQPKKGGVRLKHQDYQDECERVEVGRRFSLQSANVHGTGHCKSP